MSKNELTMRPCIVCNNIGFNRLWLGKSLADASDFRDVVNPSAKFFYELETCKFCGHNSIQTDNPCLLPTRKHDFIKYGEPTEHYPKISNILGNLNLDFKDVSIHTFSYKDVQLANFLANSLSISDINLNDHAGCSDDWLPTDLADNSFVDPQPLRGFFAEINNSKKKNKIVLVTRFFDHVASPELLQKVTDVASPTVHLVFDLNDYERLSARGTLEFIWNERRNFFHKNHLEFILGRKNQRFSMFPYESSEVSPTLSGVISHQLPKNDDVLKLTKPSHVGTDFCAQLTKLRNLWRGKLAKDHKLAIIGASHKGISLAQFVLDSQTLYALHDDKEVLKDKVAPVLPPLGFHSVSGFDFRAYTHIAITTTLLIAAKIIPKIRASGYTGEILDFDCKRLD